MPGSSGPSSLNALPVSADLIPELQRLGQRLEQARESQGLSREQQAERLHMGAEQLRALEQGDRGELPEPVFVVAQARRVAASLGVNIDAEIAALRSSAAFQASPQRAPTPPAAAPAAPSPRPSTQAAPAAPGQAARGRGPLLLAAAAALALAGGGLLLRFGNTLTSPPLQPTAPLPQPTPPAGTATETSVAAAGSSAVGEGTDLVLRAQKPSWLEVRSAGGDVLFRGTLQGERRFPLKGEIRVLAGRPDLVSASGPGLRGEVLGPIEAVRWRSFRPTAPQAPAP